MVASPWSISDNEIILDSGFAIWLDEFGFWTSSYTLNYTEIGTHDILFNAQDLGHGGGAHNWEWFDLLGTIEVMDEVPTVVTTWGEVKSLFR